MRAEHKKEAEKPQLSDALFEFPLRIFGGVDPPSAEAVWQVDSNLDHINCFVRFTYAIAADVSAEEWADANWSAELYLREAVDLVRVAFDGDVGILHFGGQSVGEDESLLLPHFGGGFQEGRSHLPRTPLRRVYDPPPARALGRDQLTMIGQMFQR